MLIADLKNKFIVIYYNFRHTICHSVRLCFFADKMCCDVYDFGFCVRNEIAEATLVHW